MMATVAETPDPSDPVEELLADLPPLMTVPEAANILRMSPEGYKAAVEQGRAPGTRFAAGGWRVFRHEMADYLRGQWRSKGDHDAGDAEDHH